MKKFIIFLFLISVSSCTSYKVYHISEVDSKIFTEPHLLYTINKTRLKILIKVKEITYIPGPYSDYATKLLGIKEIPKKSFKRYFIEKIEVFSEEFPDTSNIYILTYKKIDPVLLHYLIKENFNFLYDDKIYEFLNNFKDYNIIDFFLTRSYKSLYKLDIDTTFKIVEIDSITKKIVQVSIKEDTLDIEERAINAANMIFEIRKKRHELFSGDLDFVPQGEAAKYIHQILIDEEKENLSLFIGKNYLKDYTYLIQIDLPRTNYYKEIIGFFNENYGFFTKKNLLSDPIILEIKPLINFTSYEKKRNFSTLKFKQNFVPLLIPACSCLNILYDNEEIMYSKNVYINQWGLIQFIPIKDFIKYLKNLHNNKN